MTSKYKRIHYKKAQSYHIQVNKRQRQHARRPYMRFAGARERVNLKGDILTI